MTQKQRNFLLIKVNAPVYVYIAKNYLIIIIIRFIGIFIGILTVPLSKLFLHAIVKSVF